MGKKHSDKSDIKAVIFDLSEVFLSGLFGMRNDLASRLGIPVESIDFRIPELQLLFEGQIKEDSFWNSLLRERGWELEPLELKRMVRLNFREIEGTREVVCALRTLGYRIGLLSVHAQEWIEFCEEKFQYKDLFDVTMYSFEIAVCKPDKRAFEILLERLDLPAPRVLFIDDSLLNIEAANEMGIQVILFESATQLEAQLRDMGILL